MAADKIIRNTKLDTFLSKLATKLTAIFWRKAETTQVSIDDTPTASSNNLVKSGGVYTAVDAKYTKPVNGIPASDIESGVIPDAVEANPTVPAGTTPTTLANLKVGSGYYGLAAYPKYYLCADEAEYEAIQNPDAGTLYLIPES